MTYIKRKNALNAFSNAFYSGLAAKIKEIPSEDVAPIRHGRWRSGACSKCGGIKPMTKIEYCGSIIWEARHKLNYCPNCGARMDGGNDEID